MHHTTNSDSGNRNFPDPTDTLALVPVAGESTAIALQALAEATRDELALALASDFGPHALAGLVKHPLYKVAHQRVEQIRAEIQQRVAERDALIRQLEARRAEIVRCLTALTLQAEGLRAASLESQLGEVEKEVARLRDELSAVEAALLGEIDAASGEYEEYTEDDEQSGKDVPGHVQLDRTESRVWAQADAEVRRALAATVTAALAPLDRAALKERLRAVQAECVRLELETYRLNDLVYNQLPPGEARTAADAERSKVQGRWTELCRVREYLEAAWERRLHAEWTARWEGQPWPQRFCRACGLPTQRESEDRFCSPGCERNYQPYTGQWIGAECEYCQRWFTPPIELQEPPPHPEMIPFPSVVVCSSECLAALIVDIEPWRDFPWPAIQYVPRPPRTIAQRERLVGQQVYGRHARGQAPTAADTSGRIYGLLVDSEPGLTVKEIALRLGKPLSTVQGALNKLAAQGKIEGGGRRGRWKAIRGRT